jgi:hypothetical protein
MATPRKSAETKKDAPKSAKQIHAERVQRNSLAEAEELAASEPTSASEWKAKLTGRKLKLPSGFTALVRNPGMGVFVEEGLIPNRLMNIVLEAVDENKPPSQRVLKDMATSPEHIADSMKLANNVLLRCVIMPRVSAVPTFTEADVVKGACDAADVGEPIPIGHPSRDDEKLYVDEVDLDDKMFIFQWVVGGTHDLTSFREQQSAAVADISASASVE